MFSSIKVKLLKRGKIQKVRLLALLQDFEDRISALEEANGRSASNNSSDDDGEDDGEGGSQGTSDPSTGYGEDSLLSIHILRDGNPIQGAIVEIDGVARTTGSAGGCTFRGISLTHHSVNITIDDETTTQEIDVTEDGQTITINV